RHVKQGRLPSAPAHRLIRAGAETVSQRCKLLYRREQPFGVPHALLKLDAAAVNALKERIAFARDDRQIHAFSRRRLKVSGHTDAQSEGHIGLSVKFLNQDGHMEFGFGDIDAGQPDPVTAAGESSQSVPALLHEPGEAREIFRCTVEMSVRKGQPESWDSSAVQALPEELRRHLAAVFNASGKPERIIAAQ